MSLIRIEKNAGPVTLTKKWFINEVQSDVGTVNVTVYDIDDVIVTGPTAATKSGTGTATVYSYNVANQTALTWRRITWARVDNSAVLTDFLDVVGARLFTISEARSFQGNQLTDTTAYPLAKIEDGRVEIENFFERVCRTSFIPRYDREVFDGAGRTSIWLNRGQVTAATATEGGVLVTGLIVYPSGELRKPDDVKWSNTARRNVKVDYEHGYNPPPARVATAGKMLLLHLIAGSDVLDRAIIHTDETGTYRLSVPDDKNRPTGIPDVDSALARYRRNWGIL